MDDQRQRIRDNYAEVVRKANEAAEREAKAKQKLK